MCTTSCAVCGAGSETGASGTLAVPNLKMTIDAEISADHAICRESQAGANIAEYFALSGSSERVFFWSAIGVEAVHMVFWQGVVACSWRRSAYRAVCSSG